MFLIYEGKAFVLSDTSTESGRRLVPIKLTMAGTVCLVAVVILTVTGHLAAAGAVLLGWVAATAVIGFITGIIFERRNDAESAQSQKDTWRR